MLHLSDLRASVRTPPWTPPAESPVEALLRRARGRKHPTLLQTVPALWLPDAPADMPALAAVLESCPDADHLAAAATAALEPLRILAGPSDEEARERNYFLVAATSHAAGDLLTVLTVRQREGNKRNQRTMVAAELRQHALADDDEMIALLEALFGQLEQPEAFIGRRGRRSAPMAVLLGGIDAVAPPADWLETLQASAAVRGYRLRRLIDRDVGNEVARHAPKLLVVYEPGLQSLGVLEQAQRRAPGADVVRLSEQSWPDVVLELQLKLGAAEVRARLEAAKPQDVKAAVDRAVNEGLPASLVVLKKARKAAAKSPYRHPEDAYQGLRALAGVSERWSRGEITDYGSALSAEGITYAAGISDTARQQYRSEYLILWHGDEVLMEAHLKWGGGSDEHCLRLYFHADHDRKVMVVGHVGRHLPGAGSS